MSTEKDYFQNPGPWHMYPGSNHVVDADGNTVCTIAPDCSKAAIDIVQNAPEAVKLLGEIAISMTRIILTNEPLNDAQVFNLGSMCREALEFLKLFNFKHYSELIAETIESYRANDPYYGKKTFNNTDVLEGFDPELDDKMFTHE